MRGWQLLFLASSLVTARVSAQTEPARVESADMTVKADTTTTETKTKTTTRNIPDNRDTRDARLYAPATDRAVSPRVFPNDTRSDHARVVGHFGVGFFGVQSVPFADNGAGGFSTLDAPSIGVRYWIKESFGIEAAAGLHYSAGRRDGRPDSPTRFATVLHGAVPFVLMHRSHYKFLVIPEVNIGFAAGKDYFATPAADIDYTAFMLQMGGRAGAEIHFGFMGIPELSLQGTIGVHINYTTATASVGPTDTTTSGFSIQSSVQDAPWRIFAGNVAAIYYF